MKDLLTSMAIFPLRDGPLSVGPLKASLSTRSLLSSQSVFKRSSQKKTLSVLPLPEVGKNSFFTEAVGDFSISASLNKNEGVVKEPVVYKVSFKGRGHPRLIQLPDLSFGSPWEVYDITESQNFDISKSTKEFEVILIPKEAGNLRIPSFELNTFDPQLGIYKTHVLPEFSLQIERGSGLPENNTADASDEDLPSEAENPVQLDTENRDLSGIWSSENTESIIRYRFQVWSVLYGLLVLLFLVVLYRAQLFQKPKQPLELLMEERLKLVDQKIKHQLNREAGSQLTQLVYLFLSELSDLQPRPSSQNLESLIKAIPPSIKVRYESPIRDTLFQLEQISFAPEETAKQFRTKNHLLSLRRKVFSLLKGMEKYYYRTVSEKG